MIYYIITYIITIVLLIKISFEKINSTINYYYLQLLLIV